jgi:hypothetical protein
MHPLLTVACLWAGFVAYDVVARLRRRGYRLAIRQRLDESTVAFLAPIAFLAADLSLWIQWGDELTVSRQAFESAGGWLEWGLVIAGAVWNRSTAVK